MWPLWCSSLFEHFENIWTWTWTWIWTIGLADSFSWINILISWSPAVMCAVFMGSFFFTANSLKSIWVVKICPQRKWPYLTGNNNDNNNMPSKYTAAASYVWYSVYINVLMSSPICDTHWWFSWHFAPLSLTGVIMAMHHWHCHWMENSC